MRNLRVFIAFLFAFFLLAACQKEDTSLNTPPAVNAGKDTTINITVASGDSIKLSGTATDKDGSVVAYLWSEVSGPNTPVFSAAGSASTFVKGVIGGTYIFQLMATDNNGATGVKSIAVTVIPPQMLSVTIQQHQNPNEVLLVVNSSGNSSDRTAPELSAAAWTSGGSPAYTRGIFKFDLSAIPATATILSAKLTLYTNPTPLNGDLIHANYGTANSMLIQRVTGSWSNTLTWQTQPGGDAATQIIIPHTDQSFLDVNDIDVTNMVKDMVKNTNNGFLLRLQNEVAFNSRVFCSSKHADATKHPKLVLQYMK